LRRCLASLTFAAYGSGDGGDAVTPESVAEDKGCELIPAETEELYVQEAYDCGDGRILTFDTGEAADNSARSRRSSGARTKLRPRQSSTRCCDARRKCWTDARGPVTRGA
jgi:hypothetical protein